MVADEMGAKGTAAEEAGDTEPANVTKARN